MGSTARNNYQNEILESHGSAVDIQLGLKEPPMPTADYRRDLNSLDVACQWHIFDGASDVRSGPSGMNNTRMLWWENDASRPFVEKQITGLVDLISSFLRGRP